MKKPCKNSPNISRQNFINFFIDKDEVKKNLDYDFTKEAPEVYQEKMANDIFPTMNMKEILTSIE